jgi:hypothetical protein
MGISLGLIVFFAAGVTAAPPADRNAAQISYTVRMLEAEGVGWRSAVMSHMKPVARQGSATVWTLPKRASTILIQEVGKNPSAMIRASRVTTLSGMPATIQARQNRKFVTLASWNSGEAPQHGTPEVVRVGWHATLVGRKLDQGILVKIVLEDTEIRGVHRVDANLPAKARLATYEDSLKPASLGETKIAEVYARAFEHSPFEEPESAPDSAKEAKLNCQMDPAPNAQAASGYPDCDFLADRAMQLDPHELAAATLFFKSESQPRFKEDHRIHGASAPASDETGCCAEGSASQAANGPASICGIIASSGSNAPQAISHDVEIPEIANQEVLGEWLIPNGECLLVSFGPHTVAGKDGKAIVREHLAFVEAEAITEVMAGSAAPFNFIPAPPRAIAPPAANPPMLAPPPMPAAPAETDRAPVPSRVDPKVSDPRLPTPPPPSRSFPQGIHVDGSKANLPPLPDDEMEDESAESDSAEPLPSPQTRKPRKPKSKPASDNGTTKAVFTQPHTSTVFLPSIFLPGASVGFQFLLPIKPLSLRLPFNQRLEIEIFGRVVPETRSADNMK